MSHSKAPVILFVAPSAYVLGGVQVWLEYLIKCFDQYGLTAICGLVDGRFHSAEAYLKSYPFERSVVMVNHTNTRWGRFRSIANAIVATDADMVVSVNIPDCYEATQYVRQKYKRSIKLLATLHGLEPDYFADIDNARSILDGVLVTNQLTALAVQNFTRICPDKIHYAPYGVEVGKAQEIADSAGSENVLTILYSGRIENDQKRCSDLLGIFSDLAKTGLPFKLLLAGDGGYRKELQEQMSTVLSKEQFSFLGMVERDTLLSGVLPRCDVLIITSAWETGPIVAWEAMAANVTVVSSRYLGSVQEGALIHNQNCMLFDIGDVQAASNAIQSLQSKELRDELNKEAKKLIAQRYTIEKSAEVAAAVVKRVLEQPVDKRRPLRIANNWPVHGKIEKMFGHRLGNKIRKIIRHPSLITSAGSEWPHTLGGSLLTQEQFETQLLEFVSKSQSEKDI